jgi:hypothetical protein
MRHHDVRQRYHGQSFTILSAVLSAVVFAPPVLADVHDTPNGRGALAGRTVVLSAGHGYKPLSRGGWGWQRGTTPTGFAEATRIREDIHTNEIMIEYVQRYLSGAGAIVFTCRERSFQRHEVIVESGGSGYTESGSWTRSTSVAGYYGAGYRWADVAAGETAVATFRATLPADGEYPVYVWYTPAPDRSADALYRVRHAGGTTEVRVDQSRYRATWFYLGTYWFDAGRPAVVELSNRGGSTGKVVVADAVRFGGGTGRSGQPRWKESALAYLNDLGYRGSTSDVSIRPKFANWLAGEPSGRWLEDWRYVSLHTNASRRGSRGTVTLVYSNGRTPSWSGWGAGTAHYPTSPSPLQDAADDFAQRMNDEVVRDLAAVYPPWRTGGVKRLNAGELRSSVSMPACLLELAYHDNPDDAKHLKNAGFRHTAGRAMYKAIARSFDPNAVIVPLQPAALRVENAGNGRLRVSWAPVLDGLEPSATPTSYELYTSRDGRGFDSGVSVSGTNTTLGPFATGEAVFVRVAAVNAGGEGLPTKVVGARVARTAAPEVLIVDGFHRAFTHSYNNIDQRWGSAHAVPHATSFHRATGLAFDGTTSDAVEYGAVTLGTYPMVDWLCGRESVTDQTFSDDEQMVVSTYLGGGGALLVSGTEIGWDLDRRGTATDRDFYRDWLKASYAADDAGTLRVDPVASGALSAAPTLLLDDGSQGAFGSYRTAYPDVIRPMGGATVALDWGNGAGAAAVQYDGSYRLLHLGFPVETVWDDAGRDALIAEASAWLLQGHAHPSGGSAGGPATGASTSVGAGGSSRGSASSGCAFAAAQSGAGGLPLLALLLGYLAVRMRRRNALN